MILHISQILFFVLMGWVSISSGAVAKGKEVPKWMLVEDPPTYALSDIQRGQVAEGISVFASVDGPEMFQAEILGVMDKFFGPAGDLIIAKLSGGPVDKTGVVAGMSGSPVYIDKKLVGAVGYRFGAFTKDAIAGITPIELMKQTFDDQKAVQGRVSPSNHSKWGRAEPLATPIMVSGLTPEVQEAFASRFQERGYGEFMPTLAGGGGASASQVPAYFFPGGPIATTLVEGDIKMAGIGTVTWVKGKSFLGFGHPFMGLGRTEMPVSYANIITTVASEAGSWKLGRPTIPAGVLTDDRIYAIGGHTAKKAATVPVKVSLMGKGFGLKNKKEDFSYQLAKHPADLPIFAAVVTANTMSSRNIRPSGGTVALTGQVVLSGGQKVQLDEVVVAHRSSLAMPAAFRLLDTLVDVLQYELVEVDVASIDLTLEHKDTIDAEEIVGVRWDGKVHAGDTIPLWIQLKPFQKEMREELVKVKIPKGLGQGRFKLNVLDQATYRFLARRHGLLHRTDNYNDFLAQREKLPLSHQMTVLLVGDEDGVRLQDENISGLPIRYKRLLKHGGGMVRARGDGLTRELGRFSRSGNVAGSVSVKMHILPAKEKEWR
ncbi:MAG: hypothetical protein CMH56_05600 [Myxococcales bacterium]|nr:hypothetical protein [Myxococcales bacterium]